MPAKLSCDRTLRLLAFVLACGLAAIGCPGIGDEDPPPTATDDDDTDDGPTWESFAEAFFSDYCTACHAATLSGADRKGAPPAVDYDSYDAAVQNASGADDRVVTSRDMPPSAPFPTNDELDRLAAWVQGGTPLD